MFGLFWLYIVIFSAGPSIRDVFPVLCGLCLCGYYRHNWQQSTLRRFPAKWLFVVFFALTIWGMLFSQNVWASFLHVVRGSNQAYILPFIAMECVRDTRDLRRVLWAVALACLWQGCNGVWQSVSGFDFIDHTPLISGRLTGSLSDYRVGNYMALMLIPACALWFPLRQRFSILRTLAVLALLLGPGVYLLYFTYTRNGYLTVIVGLGLWLFVREERPHWKPLLYAGAALLAVACIVPQRLGADVLARDGRWDLWRFGWAVFEQSPIWGAGFGQYNAAFRQLGLVPTLDPVTISHPHNIYLQLLCESGVVGFGLGITFLLGFLVWGYRSIHGPLQAERARARQGEAGCHWRMTALFWCVWGAYLASGVFGHDFYRVWWQALMMTHLGVMIGAIVNGPQNNCQVKQP